MSTAFWKENDFYAYDCEVFQKDGRNFTRTMRNLHGNDCIYAAELEKKLAYGLRG